MSDASLNRFLASGTNAERLAFTPSPPTPASGPDPTYLWHETDTGDTYAWDFDSAAWDQVNNGAGALLPANNLSDVASASAARTNLGLEIGIDVQAYDAGLSSLGGLSTTGKIYYLSAADTWSPVTISTGLDFTTGTLSCTVTAGTGDLVSTNNLSDLANAGTARTNLGLAIGTNVQAYSASLASIASASTTGKLYYLSAANTWSAVTIGTGLSFTTGTLSATGGGGSGDLLSTNNLSDLANVATARTNLGLAIGTNVQAYDAELAALAGLTSAANKLPYFTGSGTAALADFTAAGRALVDDADAAAQRATLGVDTRPISFFFTTTPTASEKLMIFVACQAITLADDFAGSTCSVGTNPAASFVLDVKKNSVSVGTITISTGGVATFVTTGTTVTLASGDRLSVTAPATPDTTIVDVAITLKGTI